MLNRWSLSAAAVVGMLIMCGVRPGQAQSPGGSQIDPKLREQFEKLLVQLGDSDWQTREAATEKVAELPAAVVPLIEEALKTRQLSPEVQERLSSVIGDLRRRGKANERSQAGNRMVAAFRDQVLRDYNRNADPKSSWNALARDALVKQVTIMTSPGDRKAVRETAEQLGKVVSAGCADPLVRYWLAENEQFSDPSEEHLAAMRSAVTPLVSSDYSASLKIHALLTRARSYLDSEFKITSYRENHAILQDVAAARGLLPSLKDAPLPTQTSARDWAGEMIRLSNRAGGRDEQEVAAIADILKTAGQDPTDAPIFESRALLVLIGKRSRPSEHESSAQKENRAKQDALQARSAEIARKCASDHPQSLPALQQGIRSAAIARNDAEVRELFDRAIKIDPLDYPAHSEFAEYLVRNAEISEAMEFAQKCLRTEAYSTGIPRLSMRIAIEISRALPGGKDIQREFLLSEPVWAILDRGYREHLRISPQDDALRSEFAYWACVVERWDVADEQFQALAQNVDPELFLSKEIAFYQAKKASRLSNR